MSAGKITFTRAGRPVTLEVDDTNQVSDGYHTFGEVYEHRVALFALVCGLTSRRTWRSRMHEDGSMFDGMFIVGLEADTGTVTYHVEAEHWDLFDHSETLERAPQWDGHTSDDALVRLVEHLGLVFARRDHAEGIDS